MQGSARSVIAGMLIIVACARPEPLGVYRVPVEAGGGVELKTYLVQALAQSVWLYDAREGREVGSGNMQYAFDGQPLPIVFHGREAPKFQMYVRDGVFEQAGRTPYAKAPLPAVLVGLAEVVRFTLESDGDTLELVAAGRARFTEQARPMPALGQPPPILTLLGSVAGAGLWIPGDALARTQWRDAMSELVPPTQGVAIPCGAPFTGLVRSRGVETVEVPAGRFDAHVLSEVFDVCRFTPGAGDLRVFEIIRKLAPGVGPVEFAVTTSDAKTWRYRLTDHLVGGSAEEALPLSDGAWWAYEIVAPDGTSAGTTRIDVTRRVEVRAQP